MKKLIEAWQRYIFEPEPAESLAACRMVFFLGLFWWSTRLDFTGWAAIGEQYWFPIPLFRLLHLSLPSAQTLAVVQLVYRAALALSCVGLFTRASMVLAFLAGSYLTALPNNFGKVHHSDQVLVFLLAAFALSRAHDRFSLDALIRGRLRGRSGDPAPSGEYGWPLRFAQMLWTMVYFAAGVAKLRTSGLVWIRAESFRNLLLMHRYTHEPVLDWGPKIAQVDWLCSALAAATLTLELSAPLALFGRKPKRVIVPALLSMQLGIYLILGVRFTGFLLLLPFWIPWQQIFAATRRARGVAV